MDERTETFMHLCTQPRVRQACREVEALAERLASLPADERLAALVLADVIVAEATQDAVGDARRAGLRWQDIAHATNRSRQAAHERWRIVDRG